MDGIGALGWCYEDGVGMAKDYEKTSANGWGEPWCGLTALKKKMQVNGKTVLQTPAADCAFLSGKCNGLERLKALFPCTTFGWSFLFSPHSGNIVVNHNSLDHNFFSVFDGKTEFMVAAFLFENIQRITFF